MYFHKRRLWKPELLHFMRVGMSLLGMSSFFFFLMKMSILGLSFHHFYSFCSLIAEEQRGWFITLRIIILPQNQDSYITRLLPNILFEWVLYVIWSTRISSRLLFLSSKFCFPFQKKANHYYFYSLREKQNRRSPSGSRFFVSLEKKKNILAFHMRKVPLRTC